MVKEFLRKNSHIAINKGFGTEEFEERLVKAMERPDEPDKKKVSFAPSGLGYSGSCPRYWYYAFNGADFTYDTEPTAMANMNAGTDAGVRIANMLDKAGMLIEAEREAKYDDPPVLGYIDAVVNWKDEEIIGEVKTTHDSAWNMRATKNTVPGYQLIQVLIYMYITNSKGGFILTENKNTHQLFLLPIRMTEENKALVERVFEWMRMVKDNADNGELPTRPFTKSSFQCKGCPVREKCWEGVTRGRVNGVDPSPGIITIEPLELPK